MENNYPFMLRRLRQNVAPELADCMTIYIFSFIYFNSIFLVRDTKNLDLDFNAEELVVQEYILNFTEKFTAIKSSLTTLSKPTDEEKLKTKYVATYI